MLIETQPNHILAGLQAISAWVTIWAVPLGAIGTVSMALIQTAKNPLRLRSRFQRHHLQSWLQSKNREACRLAEADLVLLAAAGDAAAFYDSPIEQVCAQIKGVLPAVMDYPARHKPLLKCLASQADPEDVKILFAPPEADLFLKTAAQSSHQEREAIRRYAAAKLRIGAQVRCAIDALQTSVKFRWKIWLQGAALLLSAILGVVALQLGAGPDMRPTLGASLVIGVLSGFLAPVARDILAAVEKWRS